MRQTCGGRSRATIAGLLVFLLAGLTALWPTAATTQAAATNAGPTTNVRLLHAAPGGAAVDIYFDGHLVFGNAAYKDFSDYEALVPGEHRATIYPAGTDLFGSGPAPHPMVATTVSVPAGGGWWTMVAIARGSSLGFAWVKDDLSVPDNSMARVRFVHVS